MKRQRPQWIQTSCLIALAVLASPDTATISATVSAFQFPRASISRRLSDRTTSSSLCYQKPKDTADCPVVVNKSTKGNKTQRRFEEMMTRLEMYYQEQGHSLVTRDWPDKPLYQWTVSIRRNYRHQAEQSYLVSRTSNRTIQNPKFLSQGRLERLQAVDFTWDVRAVAWHKKYKQLKEFREIHGHCNVPLDWEKEEDEERLALAIWVRGQRQAYRKWQRQQPTSLTDERREALEALDFEWSPSHKERWETRLAELTEFYQEHGHSNVPQNYPPNPGLGKFCMNQRTLYRYQNAAQETPGLKPSSSLIMSLTPERIQQLESLDFVWNIRQNAWNTQLERLKAFHRQHGHVNIRANDTDHQELRLWLILQRYTYHRKKEGLPSPMTDERAAALEKAIPKFSWKVRGNGPSTKDWGKLFDAMRDMGLRPGMSPKEHWFAGTNPLSQVVKDTWTEEELLDLWNQEGGGDDGDDDIDGDVNGELGFDPAAL